MRFAYSSFGGGLPAEPDARRERLAAAGRLLERACERAAELGVQVGVETHDAFLASATVAELLALVPSPWAGAVWDSHHPCRAGETAEECGYSGWVSVEWEKHWNPEIDEPETALPQHLRLLRAWVAELAPAAGRPEGR